jgi:hypothetical protein
MREKQTKALIHTIIFQSVFSGGGKSSKNTSSRPIEHKKRTCETWQLKLSSGGGTYGIHPPKVVFFERQQRSFRPKNILLLLQRIVYLLSLSLRVFLLSRILLSALFIWRESLRERRYFFPHFFSILFHQTSS